MNLGKLEIEILNAIWDLQEINENMNISVKEISDFLKANETIRAYTTIKTVMDRLVAKEHLVRYKFGHKFYYKSIAERDELAMKYISNITNSFFKGDTSKLIQFIEVNCEDIVKI